MSLLAFQNHTFPSSGGGGDPAVGASAVTAGVNGASVAVNMPATVASGDYLVLAMAHKNTTAPAAPTGWVKQVTIAQPSGVSRELSLYTKLADGSEGGTTVTFTFTGGWSESANVVAAIQNSTGIGTAVTAVLGYATTATGPTVNITNTGGMLLTAFLHLDVQSGADMIAQVDGGGESAGLFFKGSLPAGTSPAITATAASAQYWAAISVEAIK